MVLRVKGVPLMYLPVIYYPIQDDERATGFLMPTYGTSTVRGAGVEQRVLLGDRPQPGRDASFTTGSRRPAQGAGGEYRYVSRRRLVRQICAFYRFSQNATEFTATASTTTLPAQTSYQINGAVNQTLGPRLRARGASTTSPTSSRSSSTSRTVYADAKPTARSKAA